MYITRKWDVFQSQALRSLNRGRGKFSSWSQAGRQPPPHIGQTLSETPCCHVFFPKIYIVLNWCSVGNIQDHLWSVPILLSSPPFSTLHSIEGVLSAPGGKFRVKREAKWWNRHTWGRNLPAFLPPHTCPVSGKVRPSSLVWLLLLASQL